MLYKHLRSSETLTGSVSGGRYYLSLMDLNKVNIIDLEIPNNINQKIIEILAGHHWFKAVDGDQQRLEVLQQGKSLGWAVRTMDNNKINTPLDLYADFIFQIILKKLNINGIIDRCLWNLYFPGDHGEFHEDTPNKNYFSALYPLHTTDGLTIIQDQSFTDSEGFAKVFPSNFMHKGVGPSKSPFRMNLNLVFKLDN